MNGHIDISQTVDEIHRCLKQIIANNAVVLERLEGGFASVHEALDRRLTPLEEAVRRHSKILEGRSGAA